jgi:hypothetical protein
LATKNPSSEPIKSDPTKAFDWLKWLGDHRDGFLVGIAVLYGLGYLVWSYNAWRNQLGQLPAIEFQYIMAGILPGILISITWLLAVFFQKIQDRFTTFITKHDFLGGALAVILFVPWFYLLVGMQFWSGPLTILGVTRKQASLYILPLMLLWMYFALLTMPKGPSSYHPPINTILEIFRDVYRYIIPLMLCWYFLSVYINLYPRIPQELGGPQPRCAYVDLVREEIAPSTFSALGPSDQVGLATLQSKAVRSVKLYVYFSNNDYLLARIASDVDNVGEDLKNAPLYELKSNVIRAVQWCPR